MRRAWITAFAAVTSTLAEEQLAWSTWQEMLTSTAETTVGLVSGGSTLVVVGGYTCVTQVRYIRMAVSFPLFTALPGTLTRAHLEREVGDGLLKRDRLARALLQAEHVAPGRFW